MSEVPEVFTIKSLIEQVEAGERMFIHVSQFAAFLTETEYMRIPYCIKSSVVGEQVILERWDIAGKAGDNKAGSPERFYNWLH